jgi:hypothetical protein
MQKPEGDVIFRVAIVASVAAGLGFAYAAFVLFLQTSVISLSRLAVAFALFVVFAIANYFLIFYWSARLITFRKRVIGLCFLLPLLFLPLFYTPPAYPIHPLLRQWTDVAVQYDVNADSRPLTFSKSGVRLQMDKNVLDAQSFRVVGTWKSTGDTFILDPGTAASLRWVGAATDTMLLTLQAPAAAGTVTVYWDQSRSVFELSPNAPEQITLSRKFDTPFGVSALLFLSFYILLVWLLFLLAVLFDKGIKFVPWIEKAAGSRILILLLSLILAGVTVKLQLDSLNGGADSFIHGTQLARHNAVLQGQAPNPWQYRVLSEYAAEGFIRFSQFLKIQDPPGFGFVSLRVLQNIAILLLAFALYQKISNSKWIALAGVLLLAGSMKNAFYDNDLSFNTYFDLIFYLLAVILILHRTYYWVVLVTFFAALNRETSGLIPFLTLAALANEQSPWKKLGPFVLSAGVFTIVFLSLHILYPNRPLYIPYQQTPGYQLLMYNVTRSFTWDQLYYTLGLIPIVGLLFIFKWPRLWQYFFLIMIPAWFAVHFVLSVVGETRLFLVPQAIIFIPGILFALDSLWNSKIAERPSGAAP